MAFSWPEARQNGGGRSLLDQPAEQETAVEGPFHLVDVVDQLDAGLGEQAQCRILGGGATSDLLDLLSVQNLHVILP